MPSPLSPAIGTVSSRLPAFPWDTIAEAKRVAAAHPEGLCDLSVGTPVDPTPQIVQDALWRARDAHGYPAAWGTPQLREAIMAYMTRRWDASGLDDHHVLPVIGTKEVVAWLPTHLGLGADDLIVIPTIAYPTYEVGARLAGCQIRMCDDPAELDGISQPPSLIWINYPANPHGAIADESLLKAWIDYARRVGAVLASDECYGEFGWDLEPVSVASQRLCDGVMDNLLVVNSLSKRSNFAGYRGGYLVGDRRLIAELLEVRKHGGMMVPTPVQEAMIAALGDHDHVERQRERYSARRRQLIDAFTAAGFRIDDSHGSLYLWVTRDENARVTHSWLAQRGILGAPGDFYGAAGESHVRIAFTATDEAIAKAAARLFESR